MHRLIYISKATVPVDADVLDNILMASRSNNRMVGVTGLLLYHDGTFMQCLEGPDSGVHATIARVEKDDRHEHIKTVVDEEVSGRLFDAWEMGYLPELSKMQRSNFVDIRTKTGLITGDGAIDGALNEFFADFSRSAAAA